MKRTRLSYTAHHGAYSMILGIVTFVALAELALAGTLIVVFVPTSALQLAIFGSIFVLTLAALVVAASPLWSAHAITPTHVQLRFGWLLRADIARAHILGVEAIDGLAATRTIGATYDPTERRASATLAPHGQIRIRLAEPVLVRVNLFSGGPCETVLINLDQRSVLLDATTSIRTTSDSSLPGIAHGTIGKQEVLSLGGKHSATPVSFVGDEVIGIRADGLTRRYADFTAVDRVDLAITKGEIYGFLGMNGAGKTTTIKLLVGLLEPNAGSVQLAGHDVWAEPLAARRALGYVADRAFLYERLSGREFLDVLAQIRGLSQADARQRSDNLLDLLELSAHADRPCGAYSFGMRRKLALAGALLHQPAVLIFDEPLNGLDPRSARRVKDLLVEQAAGGTTVLLSTHDLATAETLCHRIGIMHQGRMVLEGKPAELRSAATQPDLESLFLSLTIQPETVNTW